VTSRVLSRSWGDTGEFVWLCRDEPTVRVDRLHRGVLSAMRTNPSRMCRIAARALLFLLPLILAACKCGQEQPCVESSKPELEQCRLGADKLQAEINNLKRSLAQALASPGTIKIDPSVLTIGGKPIKVAAPKEGSLSQEQVVGTIRMNKGVLQACYERAMKKNTALTHQKITLTLAFQVRPSGNAADISISPNYDSMMIDCMKKAILRWHFPSFSGQPVGVESPITLTPRK
jgi:hypothetical protein